MIQNTILSLLIFFQTSLATVRPYDVASDSADALAEAGTVFEKNVFNLDKHDIRTAQLDKVSWANRQWDLAHGLVASRWLDKDFYSIGSNSFSTSRETSQQFLDRLAYVKKHPAHTALTMRAGSKRDSFIETLSPAEKYDLLVGDAFFGLTNAIWSFGEAKAKHSDVKKRLMAWEGICEGAAASSAFLPEPAKSVTLQTPFEGISVTFTRFDIRALAAMLWSQFVLKVSRSDEAGNRMYDQFADDSPAAFDTNPATFHIALMNQVGILKKHLFLDRSSGSEVWNESVFRYEMKYYNPVTKKEYSRLSDAMIEYTSNIKKKDALAKLRSPSTHFLVYVHIDVVFGSQSNGRLDRATGGRLYETVDYDYDLEIDVAGNIVGGEWDTDIHPDFLWVVKDGVKPTTEADQMFGTESWDGKPLPYYLTTSVAKASRKLQPTAFIVNKLVELSQ